MENKALLAGWASEDITPDRSVLLAGQFGERISRGVYDPLTVTALAIQSIGENGAQGDSAIMVSCDLAAFEKAHLDELRAMVERELDDFDAANILVCATHTHTAPCLSEEHARKLNWTEWKKLGEDTFMPPGEYREMALRKIKRAILAAWKGRKPAKASWELGHAVIGHCRRVVYGDGALMYGNTDTVNFDTLEGPSDHGLELMYFWDMEDALTGVIVNAACPAQVIEGEACVSADYPGAARRMIRERFSDGVHVLTQIASAGDQSPRDLVRRGKSETIMCEREGVEELGSRIADAVEKGYGRAKTHKKNSVAFKHQVCAISLPIRKAARGEVEQARKTYDELIGLFASEYEVRGKEQIKELVISRSVLERQRLQERAPLYGVELHAVRLGDAAFVTNPFELYMDYGLRIKARSRATQTFVIQLACGSAGYLPTRKAVSGGSYGADIANGMIGPDGGDLLVEYSVSAINGMWDGGKAE